MCNFVIQIEYNLNIRAMRLIIESDYAQLSQWAANHVVERINAAAPTAEKPFGLLAMMVSVVSVLMRVRDESDEKGSLKAMWPSGPIPPRNRSIPPASSIICS